MVERVVVVEAFEWSREARELGEVLRPDVVFEARGRALLVEGMRPSEVSWPRDEAGRIHQRRRRALERMLRLSLHLQRPHRERGAMSGRSRGGLLLASSENGSYVAVVRKGVLGRKAADRRSS